MYFVFFFFKYNEWYSSTSYPLTLRPKPDPTPHSPLPLRWFLMLDSALEGQNSWLTYMSYLWCQTSEMYFLSFSLSPPPPSPQNMTGTFWWICWLIITPLQCVQARMTKLYKLVVYRVGKLFNFTGLLFLLLLLFTDINDLMSCMCVCVVNVDIYIYIYVFSVRVRFSACALLLSVLVPSIYFNTETCFVHWLKWASVCCPVSWVHALIMFLFILGPHTNFVT